MALNKILLRDRTLSNVSYCRSKIGINRSFENEVNSILQFRIREKLLGTYTAFKKSGRHVSHSLGQLWQLTHVVKAVKAWSLLMNPFVIKSKIVPSCISKIDRFLFAGDNVGPVLLGLDERRPGGWSSAWKTTSLDAWETSRCIGWSSEFVILLSASYFEKRGELLVCMDWAEGELKSPLNEPSSPRSTCWPMSICETYGADMWVEIISSFVAGERFINSLISFNRSDIQRISYSKPSSLLSSNQSQSTRGETLRLFYRVLYRRIFWYVKKDAVFSSVTTSIKRLSHRIRPTSCWYSVTSNMASFRRI